MKKIVENQMSDSSNTNGESLIATESSLKTKLMICWKLKITPTFIFADEWFKYQQIMDLCLNTHHMKINDEDSEVFNRIVDQYINSLRSYQLSEDEIEPTDCIDEDFRNVEVRSIN